jgi:hypothetical protein
LSRWLREADGFIVTPAKHLFLCAAERSEAAMQSTWSCTLGATSSTR